jgi:hypothetical protein
MKKEVKKINHSMVKNNVSAMYPIRLKFTQRKKAEVVARNKGRKLSEHIHWLINQSISNYEVNHGEIILTQAQRRGEE